MPVMELQLMTFGATSPLLVDETTTILVAIRHRAPHG